jgi:NifB/MoaA-like Fe-S oxidoreductase
VTVAGLLTGSDIVTGLTRWRQKQTDVRPLVLLPKVMLEFERRVFLDGLTLEDVEKMLGIKIIIVEPTGEGIVKTILQMSCGKRVGV